MKTKTEENQTVRWCDLGRTRYAPVWELQRDIHTAVSVNDLEDTVLVTEHEHVYTLGKSGDINHLLAGSEELKRSGVDFFNVDRGGDITYHGPGQIVCYPILNLERFKKDVHWYLRRLEEIIIRTLRRFDVDAERSGGETGVWVGKDKIAALGIKVGRWTTMHGFAFNVHTDLSYYERIIPCGIFHKGVTSLAAVLQRHIGIPDVLGVLKEEFGVVFGVELKDVGQAKLKLRLPPESPGETEPKRHRPDWLKVKVAGGPHYAAIKNLVGQQKLHTVCEEARCPNMGECWTAGTATFMILGDTCTRNCGFCAVKTGRPADPDPEEPRRVADAVKQMGLSHAVITSVNRDDRSDGGAHMFAETIRFIRQEVPGCTVEVLIPDFKGAEDALITVLDAGPDVLNHNIETVPGLYKTVRPQANYRQSLEVLLRAKERGFVTKSGIMVGIGETPDEVLEVMRDLRGVGCDILTIGQYLQPTKTHVPVDRFVHPDEFDMYRVEGERIGFKYVESGPLVRSSYHAERHVQPSKNCI